MEQEKLESTLIDYIDGKLSAEERAAVESLMNESEEAQRLCQQLREVMQVMEKAARLEPRASMKANFEKALSEEILATKKKTEPSAKQMFIYPQLYRIAATLAFVLLGVASAYWIIQHQRNQKELMALRQEMEETKKLMLSLIDNPLSASQRVQGVNVALTISTADDDVVSALVKAMNGDANTNVRLAALAALSNFYNEPSVRKTLISSLATQKDPVVQIALIQLLVKMKEKSVVNDLEQIVNDAQTIKAVKDEAYSGLLKLS